MMFPMQVNALELFPYTYRSYDDVPNAINALVFPPSIPWQLCEAQQ